MSRACYVYAIMHRTAVLPSELTGLNGEPLAMVPWQALAAVVGVSSESQIRPTADRLLRHETVVEALCTAASALPVRFGTILPDEAAVERSLADRAELLQSDLARVGDKLELGLTVLWAEGALAEHVDGEGQASRDAGPSSETQSQRRGTRYLLARREAYRRERIMRMAAGIMAAELDQRVRPQICESRFVVDTQPGLAIRAAFLVDRGAFAEAQAALTTCRSLYPAHRFLITGPWPPYSFVSPPSADTTMARGSPRPAPTEGSISSSARRHEEGRSLRREMSRRIHDVGAGHGRTGRNKRPTPAGNGT